METNKTLCAFIAAITLAATNSMADPGWKGMWIGADESTAPKLDPGLVRPEILIKTAMYGKAGEPTKQIDLRAKLQKEVERGKYTITVGKALAGGDPAYGIEKTLELVFSVDGKLIKKSLQEGEEFAFLEGPAADLLPRDVNRWSCFRKVFHCEQKPTKAIVRIAADSKYWLWVNGQMVVFEGQLKRGPTPHDTYFDRVDLTGHLQQGDNTIAVLLWYFGKHGFSHNSSGKAGLVFDAVVDGKSWPSDASWKATIHPAYENTGPPHPNFRLPESNVRFDARNDIAGWQAPGFDDSAWPVVKAYGLPPSAPWNQLVERPIPMWKDFGLKDYENASEIPKVSNGKLIRAKLPYNAQVTPYLEVEGPAGQLIDLRMDNGIGGRAEYVTVQGHQVYESLGWLSGHEVHYTIPAGFKILALKYRETGYDTSFAGSFECDDEFFNRHHKKALRTLYINMRDTYMDCPDRERAQWWGDVVNQLGEAFYALDPRSYDLARKGMLELTNWQRPDHTIFAPIPGNWKGELKLQMLNSVGYYGFWTYYLYSGDLDTLRAVYPAVKRYLSIWKLGDDGLVVSRGAAWTDWGENKDFTILNNGWYYLALKGQLNMAKALGEADDAAEVEKKMSRMEQSFNQTFWTGSEYRSPEYKDLTDDRAHALAVISGLAKPEYYEAIRAVFKKQEHCSPYMEKYVGEALYQMRYPEDALARTKKRFQKMTDHPYTTLWEIFPTGGTINHAWSGGALTLLSQYGAGVAPETPGYESYHVLPQMGHLNYIKTRVPSAKGNIDVELRRTKNALTMNLHSPAKTTAIIGIPKRKGEAIARITCNDTTIWEGTKSKPLDGVEFREETEHYVQFTVQPGNWSFESQTTE
ncbi:MAG: alpha-L-rhamnosidase C-terminal domain-containing protein [Akkermansiaceae bacterium]